MVRNESLRHVINKSFYFFIFVEVVVDMLKCFASSMAFWMARRANEMKIATIDIWATKAISKHASNVKRIKFVWKFQFFEWFPPTHYYLSMKVVSQSYLNSIWKFPRKWLILLSSKLLPERIRFLKKKKKKFRLFRYVNTL